MPEYKEEGFDASRIRVKSTEGKLISLNELVTVSHMEEAPQAIIVSTDLTPFICRLQPRKLPTSCN